MFRPPAFLPSVLDRRGGFTMLAARGSNKGGTLWRPGKVLRALGGTLVQSEPGRFYQTVRPVTWADYKVPGYANLVRTYWNEATGERIA